MGKDFKHHYALLEEELQVLWELGVIIITGGACVMAGQSLGCNSCSPITPVGSSIPAGSWDCTGDKPHVRHGALLGRAESSALLVSGTSPHWEQWWEVGKDTAPAQPHLPAPTCPTDRNLLALGGSPLCHRSLFNLPEVYLEDMGRCRKIFSEGKKKVNRGHLQPRKRS